MAGNKIPAAILRNFVVPEIEEEISPHGSQREDSILREYLPGWQREASDAAKSAFLPGVAPVKEGNGRGRGATFIDGFRVDPRRSFGGDFVSLKAPTERKSGAAYTTAHDLFTGTSETLIAILSAMRRHFANRKAFPLVVCHTSGDTFAPELNEWCIVDLPTALTNVTCPPGWQMFAGFVPIKPESFRAGRGGNPTPVWVSFDRKRGYWTLCLSLRGYAFTSGSQAMFAEMVDRATTIR